MVDWRWRSGAKCIALIDMVFSLIELVMLIVVFVDPMKHMIYYFTHDHTISEVMSIIWFFLGIAFAILFSLVQFFAAMKLYHATEEERDPLEASKMAMLWQIVTLIYIVLAIVGCLLLFAAGAEDTFGVLMVGIFVRGMFLCIVHKFTTTLETEAATPRIWSIC